MVEDEPNRRCQTCIEEHGEVEPMIMNGHVVSKGRPATFRCCTCGRKAYWNSGHRVPSLTRWFMDKLKSIKTRDDNNE